MLVLLALAAAEEEVAAKVAAPAEEEEAPSIKELIRKRRHNLHSNFSNKPVKARYSASVDTEEEEADC